MLCVGGACLLLFGACSSEATPSAAAPVVGGVSTLPVAIRGGARLEARFDSFGPVGEVFRTFYDTKLGIECHMLAASDGATRCLPAATYSAEDVFSDASCETRLVVAPRAPCKPSTFAAATTPCPSTTKIHALAGETRPAVVYSRGTTGECAPQPIDADTTYYGLGDEVPPTEFVATKPKVFTDEGLSTVMLDGDDGSRAFGVFRDAKRNADCTPRTLLDESVRCVPVDAATVASVVFADAQCAVRGAATVACKEPLVAVEADACGGRAKVFAVGPRVKSPSSGTKAACAPLGSSPRVYPVGGELAPADLPRVFEVPPPRDYRIYETRWSAPGGPIGKGLYDAEKQTECQVSLAEDGKRRCLPTSLGPVSAYADAACTRAVVFAPCGGAPSPFAYEYADPNASCSRNLRIRKRGVKVDVPSLFVRGDGGGCAPRAKPTGAVDSYEVGETVPAAEFVEAVDLKR